jgi:predicted RND superfamily exporter protein
MIRFCTRRPRLVIGGILLATAVFALSASRVTVDPSVESMLPGSRADRAFQERFVERFGSDELVFVALRLPHPFGSQSLAVVERISQGLREIPQIDRVVSPTTVTHASRELDGEGEASLVIEPLVRFLPRTDAEEDALWRRATSDPLLVRNLISPPSSEGPAGPSTVLVVGRIVERPGDLTYRREIARQVRALVAEELAREPTLAVSASIAGVPIVKAVVVDLTLSELLRIEPLAWAANALIVFALFRRLRATVFTLLIAGVSLLWTLGLLTWLGSSLNILSIVVLELVKALAVVTAIHVLAGHRRLASAGVEPSELAAEAAQSVALPSFLSTLTSSLGCLGLALSGIDPMRDVGVYSAFGLMVGWLLAMTLLPALLALGPSDEPGAAEPWTGARTGEWLARVVGPACARPTWTIAVVLVLTVVAGLGVLRLRVESSVMAMLDPAHPIRVATDAIGAEVSGIQPLEIVVRTAPGEALEPATLARVEELQRWLDSQPKIDRTLSIVDYLKRLNGPLQDDGSGVERLPETAAQAGALLFLAESQDRSDLADTWLSPSWEDPTHLRVTVRSRVYSAEDTTALVDRIRAHLVGDLHMRDDVSASAAVALEPGALAAGMTGVMVLFANTRNVLLNGQWSSWLIALGVIWLALIAAMRSIRVGTIAIIPNALPSVMMFGYMGWAGIPLDFATGLTAAISTAIADDDTIHLLSGYRARIAEGAQPREAIREAIREVGPVILLAAVVLALGFFTFSAATFGPVFNFGVLAGATVLTAVLYDLFLLPAMLLVGHRGSGR